MTKKLKFPIASTPPVAVTVINVKRAAASVRGARSAGLMTQAAIEAEPLLRAAVELLEAVTRAYEDASESITVYSTRLQALISSLRAQKIIIDLFAAAVDELRTEVRLLDSRSDSPEQS